MRFFFDPTDLIPLRLDVDQLAELKRPERELIVSLPAMKGQAGQPADMIEVGEVLKATLTAVSKATRRLRSPEVGMALGSEPLTMQLSGRFLGILPDRGEIYIRVAPAGKEK